MPVAHPITSNSTPKQPKSGTNTVTLLCLDTAAEGGRSKLLSGASLYNTVLRDMTAYGLSEMEPVGDSVIQETTPDGDVIWEWSTWGNVPLDDFTVFPRFPGEYAHVNSIFLTR